MENKKPEPGYWFNDHEIVHIWRHENPYRVECGRLKCEKCQEWQLEGWLLANWPTFSGNEDATCHQFFVCDDCCSSATESGGVLSVIDMTEWSNDDDLTAWADIEKAIRGAQ